MPVRVAVWPSGAVWGGSKLPPICWMSFIARPTFSAGSSSRKAYHGSSSCALWICAAIIRPLPHRAVGRLPEIAALGMLQVGAARDEGDLYIGQRGTGQHTKVLFFFEMGQHQTLPVLIQHLFAAVGRNCILAAAGQRFQLEVDFGIVAERLIVAHALDGLGDRLLI